MLKCDFLDNDIDIKYLGMLNGANLIPIDLTVIKILLEKNVIVLDETHRVFGSSSISFTFPIVFNSYCYKLHPNFKKELFSLLSLKVLVESDPLHAFEEIDNTLNAFFDKEEKIKYLKTEYSRIYKGVNYQDHLLFTEEGYHGMTYDQYATLSFDVSPLFIVKYLTTSYTATFKQFITKHEDKSSQNHLLNDFFTFILTENMESTEDEIFDLIEEYKKLYETTALLELIKDKISNLNSNDINQNLSALEIAYYAYYHTASNTSFTKEVFPSEKGYKELSEKFGANWKNIQQNYNEIYGREYERLKKNRYKKIENILSLLTIKEVRELAEKEINISKNNS
ncbi:hypothetical protein [Mesoflavibacter sp. CH_XMU1422-2]|uniref:hypothetical protein n=1 Tax=Mesoflavibacter sp. CH_XMU1422-2 TaxID=3107770 RepID=UPI0030087EF0